MEILNTLQHAGLTINIHPDDLGDNCPLDWDDTWGQWVTFERDSTLSDYHDYANQEDALAMAKKMGFDVFPLIKYEHGQVAYSTTREYPFDCQWDAGQVGFIFINPKECSDPAKYAAGQCETMTTWCNGGGCGYVVEGDDGEQLDACWGFYDIEDCEGEAKSVAEYHALDIQHKRQDRLKTIIRNHVPLTLRQDALTD